MTHAEAKYLSAIRALNSAAYDAIRASRDHDALPMVNRQLLRRIARMTGALVDAGLETAKDDEK